MSTNLFSIIENREWEQVVDLVSANPEKVLAPPTTEGSFYSSNNNAMHEACKNQPPLDVIEAMLKASPDSVKAKGQWGYLPLHYACVSGASHDVISKLITAYPSGARSRDDNEKFLPIHLACKWGASKDVLLKLLTIYPESIYIQDANKQTPLHYASKISDKSTRDAALAILKQGPMLCVVSKAGYDRSAAEGEKKIRKIENAHKSKLAAVESRHEEAIDELNKAIKVLRDQVSDVQTRNLSLEESIIKAKKDFDDEKTLMKTEHEEERTVNMQENTNLEEEVATAKKLLNATQQKTQEQAKLVEEMTTAKKELEEENELARQENANLEEEVTQLKQQLKDADEKLEKQTELAKEQAKDAVAKFNAAEKMHNEATAAITEERDQAEFDMVQVANNMEQERKDFAEKMENQRIEFETEKYRLKEQAKELNIALEEVQSELDTEISKNANLEKQLKTTQEEVADAEKNLQVSLSCVDRLKNQLSTEKETVSSLEKDISSFKPELAETKKLLEEERAECSSHVAVIEEQNEKISSLNEKLIALKQRLNDEEMKHMGVQDELKEALAKHDDTQQEYINTLQELESKLKIKEEETSKTTESLRSKIRDLNEELISTKVDLKETQEKLDDTTSTKEQEGAEARSEIESLESELSTVKDSNRSITMELKSTKSELEVSQSELEEVQSILQKKRTEFARSVELLEFQLADEKNVSAKQQSKMEEELQSSKLQIDEVTETLNKTKSSFEEERQRNKNRIAELKAEKEDIDNALQEKLDTLVHTVQSVAEKDEHIAKLEDKIQMHERCERTLAVKTVKLEQERNELQHDLSNVRDELNMSKLSISEMKLQLTNASQKNRSFAKRMSVIQKYANAIAGPSPRSPGGKFDFAEDAEISTTISKASKEPFTEIHVDGTDSSVETPSQVSRSTTEMADLMQAEVRQDCMTDQKRGQAGINTQDGRE